MYTFLQAQNKFLQNNLIEFLTWLCSVQGVKCEQTQIFSLRKEKNYRVTCQFAIC